MRGKPRSGGAEFQKMRSVQARSTATGLDELGDIGSRANVQERPENAEERGQGGMPSQEPGRTAALEPSRPSLGFQARAGRRAGGRTDRQAVLSGS